MLLVREVEALHCTLFKVLPNTLLLSTDVKLVFVHQMVHFAAELVLAAAPPPVCVGRLHNGLLVLFQNTLATSIMTPTVLFLFEIEAMLYGVGAAHLLQTCDGRP